MRHRRRVLRSGVAARAARVRPQLPDAVRRPDPHEAGIPTIAVGAIASYDDVNTIICAGRADLCALARPHLYDPAWTLHAAAEQEFDPDAWVPQYQAGSRKPPAGRDRVRAELERTFEEVELISSSDLPG